MEIFGEKQLLELLISKNELAAAVVDGACDGGAGGCGGGVIIEGTSEDCISFDDGSDVGTFKFVLSNEGTAIFVEVF